MTRPLLMSVIGFAAAIAALLLALSLDNADEAARPAPLTPVAAEQTLVPSIDVVRLGERGDAVIAGRAPANSEVTILDDDRELGRAAADGRGEWVFVPTGPLPAGARLLAVRARTAEGAEVAGAAPVILVVVEHAGEPPLAVQPLAGGGARLLNRPPGDGGPVSVDLVERDGGGMLFAAGRAQPRMGVHLYADKTFLGRGQAGADGGWTVRSKAPSGAVAALRADMVDDRGRVVARVEVPYEADAVPSAGDAKVSVEPGQSLWRIGHGATTTVVYAPGSGHRADPGPVKPGQLFQAPK